MCNFDQSIRIRQFEYTAFVIVAYFEYFDYPKELAFRLPEPNQGISRRKCMQIA